MRMREKKVVLEVGGLTKCYGELKAVDQLDLSLEEGEIFGLLGHNGAGKSTTIECLLGVKKKTEGRVKLLGLDPEKDRKQLFEKVGVQFQETHYQDKIKVKEICELTASLYKEPLDYKKLLKDFGLGEKRNALVEELSGGQRQRLSVLLAVLPNPKLIFLDELTTGLDPEARWEIWKLIKELQKRGTTIFLTSHYMDEVEKLCGRIAILKRGKVIVTGTVEEVLQKSSKANLEEAYLFYVQEGEKKDEDIYHTF